MDEGEGFLFGSSSNVVVTIRDDDTPLGAARWISGGVDAVHAVPGGRWLLSGAFDRVDGIPRAGLARFGSDGSFDPSFRPPDSRSEASPRVAVDAQGRVVEADIVRPSRSRVLDQRALAIVRAASPFGPFTPAMRRQADQIVITSRFRFTREDGLETTLSSNR